MVVPVLEKEVILSATAVCRPSRVPRAPQVSINTEALMDAVSAPTSGSENAPEWTVISCFGFFFPFMKGILTSAFLWSFEIVESDFVEDKLYSLHSESAKTFHGQEISAQLPSKSSAGWNSARSQVSHFNFRYRYCVKHWQPDLLWTVCSSISSNPDFEMTESQHRRQ